MKVIRSLEDYTIEKGSVVALGNFDGVHIGHREILLNAVRKARKNDCIPVCFTFSNHTRKEVSLICTEEEKLAVLESVGIEVVLEIPFDETIRNTSAEDFVERILWNQLHAKAICCGFNFRFGKCAAGDVKLMEEMGKHLGMEALISEPVYVDDQVVSSTLVRKLITDGDMERAAVCLGRNFYCTGEVVHGAQLGGKIGFPTANVVFESYRIAPPNGVYYTLVNVDGTRYPGITDVGVKPTVGIHEKSIETNMYGFHQDLYGKKITIEFLKWERPEKRFESVEMLRSQIQQDYENGRKYHQEHGYLQAE